MKALKFLKHMKQTDTPYNFRECELDEAIAELEALQSRSCEGCKHKPNDGECYYEPCGTCARFFYDHYSPKDNA